MTATGALIDRRFAEWGHAPAVFSEVCLTRTPAVIAEMLEAVCVRRLGSPVAFPEFLSVGVGVVLGARLRDGRRVVLKVHRPRVSEQYLAAVQEIQTALRSAGFPAPAPLGGPFALGGGKVVVESLEDRGEIADARDAATRGLLACGLAELVALARPLVDLAGLSENPMIVRPGRVFPDPHDPRFDLGARGGEWIDAIAARAAASCDTAGDRVVGHSDWRAEHVRVESGRLSAVYDWDSLSIAREPIVAGQAAHGFTMDWENPKRQQLPTLEEALGFLTDYQAARGAAFSRAERRAAQAALIYTMAYTARCEHSDATRGGATAVPEGTARAFLRTHADALLPSGVGPF